MMPCDVTQFRQVRQEVATLEAARALRMEEFVRASQQQLRDKLHDNFVAHLEQRDDYRRLLDAEEPNDALLASLENEVRCY